MAIVEVRTSTLGKAYAASVDTSFASLPAVGNHIVAATFGFASGTLPSSITFSDNQSNTYAQAVFRSGTGHFIAIGATTTPITTSAGTFTVTATNVGGTGTIALECGAIEYSGLSSGNPLDVTVSATGSGTTWDTTAAASTAQAAEVFLSVMTGNTGNASTSYTQNTAGSAPSSGWVNTFVDVDDTNFLTGAIGSVIVAATQAPRDVQTVTTAATVLAALASFKGAAAPAGTTIAAVGRRMIGVHYA